MTVAILSPSLAGDPGSYPRVLENLKERGLTLTFRDQREEHQAPFIASDRTRAKALGDTLADPCVDGILFARGGYGAMRLLPYLESHRRQSRPPLIVGLSDITNIHCWLEGHTNMPSFHGPHLRGLSDRETFDLFWKVASGTIGPSWELPTGEAETVREGEAAGVLTGGNLETLSHLAGSPWLPSGGDEDRIVLLEDIDEPMYAIDRAIRTLIHAGYFGKTKGIVLGPFLGRSPRPDDPAGSVEELVRTLFPDIPIMTAALCGHGSPMATWPLGVRVTLQAPSGGKPGITLLEDPFDRT